MRVKHVIIHKREDIGYIQLVSYLTGDAKSHIEFYLDPEYRGQGIMGKELSKYLKRCKKYGNNQLIAVVKKDNIASIKLLEKNNFIKISHMDDKICYIVDLNLTKEFLIKTIKMIDKNFPVQIYD